MEIVEELMKTIDKATARYGVMIIPDMDAILDGENVPAEEGEAYNNFQKERYGNVLTKNNGPAPPALPFNRQDFKRNKEYFMTDREKQEREDEFLRQHGINF